MEARGRVARKEHFYEALFALDADDDDKPLDKGRCASKATFASGKPAPHTATRDTSRVVSTFSGTPSTPRVPHPRQLRPGIERTVSAPGPDLTATSDNSVDHSNTLPRIVSYPILPSAQHTMPRPPPTRKPSLAELARLPRAPGKRKTDTKIKLVPESRRIFKDLVFFFFPNNDTHAGRRMRITKALEYGAIWVVDWCEDVTHVIVDNGIRYDQITSYLNTADFPGDADIVNESYPADCIVYRSLVDPAQQQYLIQGYTKIATRNVVSSSSAQSTQSLQLKPAPRDAKSPDTQNTFGAGDGSNELAQQKISGSSQDLDHSTMQLVKKQRPQDTLNQRTFDLLQTGQARTTAIPTVRGENPGAAARESKRPTVGEYDDDLEAIIAEAKNTAHLPLDTDDEDSTPQTSETEDTDTEDERPRKKPKKQQPDPSTEQWQCMSRNDGTSTASSTNPNARTIQILTEMCNYYEQTRDEWRSRAYRRAIATLRKQPRKITTKEEAAALPFIGARLAAKIEEIVWTDRLRRLDAARAGDSADDALRAFLGIYGVGPAQASRWAMQGLRSLDDLRAQKVRLSPTQLVGLERYEDFRTRIPRDEVAMHAEVVRTALMDVDPAFSVTVGGSFRRGARDSGDVDLILSCPMASLAQLQAVVFEELVPRLMKEGFLKVALAAHSHARHDTQSGGGGGGGVSGSGGGTKWHGASALPLTAAERAAGKKEVWRRIDLLLVPPEQLGAALLYFTGNDIFNRSIRLLASRKGMRLNQRGLYRDVMRGRAREKITEGELVEGRSERRIFEVLGVPWRPPEHRIC